MGWLYYSNLHISFVAAGIILGSYALADERVNIAYLVLAAAGALLIYHADRVFFKSEEDIENVPGRLEWYGRHPSYIALSSVFAVLGIGISVFYLPTHVLYSGAGLGLVGLLYAAPLPGTKIRIKDLPFLKTLLILVCWVGGGLLLPLWRSMDPSTLMLLGAYRALYILPNLILAEWVDSPGDSSLGLRSAGALLTIGGIRVVSVLCFMGALVCSVVLVQSGANALLLSVDIVGFVVAMGMIFSGLRWTSKHVVWLDMLVGFPAATWLIYFIVK